ncbi:lactonase family protein [Paenibacillus sp. NPDC056579]|uniref:lactonase family protein n=1 Tax=Paenibacillus sp. NPDC056579 TaxID=3345871 RepID=UPI0036ABB3D6
MTTARIYRLFVGSYTPANDRGIHLLEFDSETGYLEYISGMSGIENPSFVAIDSTGSRIYVVSETLSNGAVVSIQVDPETNQMTEINRQPTHGGDPCQLSLDSTGRWLFTVNYSGGSVCVYPMDEYGAIQPVSDMKQHSGRSIRDDRQEGPHPHSIMPVPGSRSCLLVPDLGTDTIYSYRHHTDSGKLDLTGQISVDPGSGPRHLAFHPILHVLYVINELSSTISAYQYNPATGSLSLMQQVTTLPESFSGASTCADIHLSADGMFLYGSNRGHDSLCIFRVDREGLLDPIRTVPTMGSTPRNFAVIPAHDCDYILVGNQDSNQVVVMRTEQGIPISTGITCEVNRPSCIIPVAKV